MQQAMAEYDSLREQAESHVHALELTLAEERHHNQSLSNQLQGSYLRVQSLQNDLAGANAHIQSLLSQIDLQHDPGRLQPQSDPPAMMHNNSIPETSRCSPGLPTGSSRSSGSSGSRSSGPIDVLVNTSAIPLALHNIA